MFPQHVDAIVIGTGLTNSIIAAACSRVGKIVLHLDENNYYGNHEASFTFQQLIDWIKTQYPNSPSIRSIPQELLDKSRLFCLDLAPRFLFSNGELVDLLVKSNVARYHEFKNNIRILCLVGQNDIHVLPCRRNEVFTSPLLSNLADKRRLMKFIEACVKHQDNEEGSEIGEHGDQPIGQYLEERGMKSTLREYIINSIAMIHPTDTTREACKRIKNFMVATERYGRSPFLFPLYGCGEFPQSFCRMSAVFGGTYCLSTQIKEAKRQDEEPKAGDANVHSSCPPKFMVRFGEENYVVTSDMLVVDQSEVEKLNLAPPTSGENECKISRAILITNKSIVDVAPDDGEQDGSGSRTKANDLISFMRIPPTEVGSSNIVYLIELNSSALVCPAGLNIVYMWTKSAISHQEGDGSSAEQDLRPTVERLFSAADDSSQVVWKFFYQQKFREAKPTTTVDENDNDNKCLFVTRPAFDDIDYGAIIREAESLFKTMCPGEEFLPRAPDPDEIIHSD